MGNRGRQFDMAPALAPHALLERLCDDFGPRLTGSSGNAAAMNRLADELRALVMHAAVYAGVPAGNAAIRWTKLELGLVKDK